MTKEKIIEVDAIKAMLEIRDRMCMLIDDYFEGNKKNELSEIDVKLASFQNKYLNCFKD